MVSYESLHISSLIYYHLAQPMRNIYHNHDFHHNEQNYSHLIIPSPMLQSCNKE
jgi:hypothetical protein